jgi:hypothetical protein
MYSTCVQEDNQQGDASSCKDAKTCAITPESTAVDINCGDIFSGTIKEGSEITISAPDGAILPEDITCMIGPSGRDVCQTVTINTSGNIDLQLKDRFRSLELMSCDENNCFTDVTYVYNLHNIGQSDITITKADTKFKDNAPESILDQFLNLVLAPNETTSVTDTQMIDICITTNCVVVLEVDANIPFKNVWVDMDTYTLTTNLPPTLPCYSSTNSTAMLFVQLVCLSTVIIFVSSQFVHLSLPMLSRIF